LSVGDVVDVSGTITSRVLSGVASERQITSAVVSRIGQTTPLGPLAMNCRSVGGSPIEPNVAGVKNGVGANNIGLPATVVGRVTFKSGQYIYVDDGSNVEDVSGRLGVMVKCASTSIPVGIGDIAAVTGIIQGSVPTGWTTNRRYIQARTADDVRLVNTATE
jgi:hypothetical protein